MKRFLLHIVLAVMWMLMFQSFDLYTLLAGLLVATVTLSRFERPGDGNGGLRLNPWRLVRFALYFIRILIVANWQVARLVLDPAMPIRPRIIRYDVAGMTPTQITALANAITLTPGTLAVDLAPDDRFLYIHCINAASRQQAVRELDELKARLTTEVFV